MLERNVTGTPLRVLVLDTVMDRGGAETMSMNYLRHFDRSKVIYDFLVNREYRAAYEDEIESLGGRVYRMCPMYPKCFNQYKREFRQFLIEHPEYRVIHSNLEERSYFPLRIAKEMGIPVRIAHAHNEYKGFDAKTLVRQYFRSRLSPYYTHGFACSAEAAKWLFGSKAMESGRVQIVQNAIDSTTYRFNGDERLRIRKELDVEESFVMGNVGRFFPQKNHSFLLDVFSSVLQRVSNAKLLLVGAGDLEGEIKNKAINLGILDKVVFTGSVPNVWDYLQAMDLFVFPSIHEGLGMSLIEAQAVGLPCIASDAVPEEANISGQVTYLSLDDGAEAWATECEKFVSCPRFESDGLLQKTHFDVQKEAVKLQNFYLDQLKKNDM